MIKNIDTDLDTELEKEFIVPKFLSEYEYGANLLNDDELISEIEKSYKKYHPTFTKESVNWNHFEYLIGLLNGVVVWGFSSSDPDIKYRVSEYVAELFKRKLLNYKIIMN
jgi:hypothetical protein